MIGRLAVLLVSTAIGASDALAGDNVSVTITATVLPVCKFFSTASRPDAVLPPIAIRYSCTNGMLPSFSLPPSARATCFACEGTIIVGTTARPNLVARGFGVDSVRTEIATEQLLRAALIDGSGTLPGAMTVIVVP